ncbi:aminotransferase class V-fold PLP-dependent enzyme [Pikeienuella piscinae]|uniref:Aminotransferase class V-fold PLP-dependent enzyme n=1 Tax=Pikeienuella piscinae TaxID=2748098 RepID=A0A7M3T6R1_9RHOB|nr:aminotransferase class V-fold PLP-dependent enzyme [Pikeienuella piscinae]
MIPCQRALFDIPRDVAYLNTAYMSPLSHAAVAAIDRGARMKARPWDLTIPDFYDAPDRARALFAGLVNADAAGVALAPSASYGIESAARNIPLAPGRRVVLLKDQFPSHVYPWRRRAVETGAEVFAVAAPPGEDATAAVLTAIDERCAVAALPNVLWTTGARIDLAAVRRRCDETGAALVLDLTQSAGAMVTDFAAIRPDFATAAAYKWLLGPYATGFLYVAPERRDGAPLEEGWITRKDSRNFAGLVEYTDEYEPGALRFDMGERANFALLPGLIAALEQLTAWGVANIEETLAARAAGLSKRIAALGLSPTPDVARGPHYLSAGLPVGAPKDLLARLAAKQVYLSERGGALRVTPHLWNDEEDCDRLVEALASEL